MGLSHAEFFRLLPKALDGLPEPQITPQYSPPEIAKRIAIQCRQQTIEIRLSPQGLRTIASLRLPVTQVEIILCGYTKEAVDKFIRRFDLAYQKGGG